MLGSVHQGLDSLLLDRRPHGTYSSVKRAPKPEEFIDFVLSPSQARIPAGLRKVLVMQLSTNPTLVLSHGSLSPSNIIVANDVVTGILGWDSAGMYPKWWDYVKFFDTRTAPHNQDWYDYADEIFTQTYVAELAAYQAVLRFSP